MKKTLIYLALSGISLTTVVAQERAVHEKVDVFPVPVEEVNPNHSKAKFTSVETKSKTVDAVTIAFPISEEELEEIFENKMKSVGAPRKSSKWKEARGYRSYQALTIGEVSMDKMDYYYALDGNKENSSITIAASRGYDNFLNKNSDPNEFRKIQNFLESMNEDVDSKNWQKRIMAQEDVVKATNNELAKDQTDLEKLQSDLENIKQNIEAKKAEIEQDKVDLQKAADDLQLIKNKKL